MQNNTGLLFPGSKRKSWNKTLAITRNNIDNNNNNNKILSDNHLVINTCTFLFCIFIYFLFSINYCENVICIIVFRGYASIRHDGNRMDFSRPLIQWPGKDKLSLPLGALKRLDVTVDYQKSMKKINGASGLKKKKKKGGQCGSAKTLHSIIWPAGTVKSGCKQTYKKKKLTVCQSRKEQRIHPFTLW